MSKGIAINTVLLLIIGIIVVVVMIYLIYSTATKPALSIEQCKTKMRQHCILCANMGWERAILASQELIDCGNEYSELSDWSDNTHCTVGGTKTDCQAIGVG
jgi:hypothetical protein